MPEFLTVLTPQEIEVRVSALAETISKDYKGKDLVLIGVLKGAFIFLADLVRKLSIPATIDFTWYSSYGKGDASTGEVTRLAGIRTDVSGKDVLIVEDILDTGLTLQELVSSLWRLNPSSVRICAFIDKQERRETDIRADYTGHTVEKGFLVGYGLDYAEQYRNFPAIYELKE